MMSCRCENKGHHDCKHEHYAGACDCEHGRREYPTCGCAQPHRPVCHPHYPHKPHERCAPVYHCTPSVRPKHGRCGFMPPELFSFYSSKFCRTINVRVWRQSDHCTWYSIKPHKYCYEQEPTTCYHEVDPSRFPGRFECVKPIPCHQPHYCPPPCPPPRPDCACEALNIPGRFECPPPHHIECCDWEPRPPKRCRPKTGKRKMRPPMPAPCHEPPRPPECRPPHPQPHDCCHEPHHPHHPAHECCHGHDHARDCRHEHPRDCFPHEHPRDCFPHEHCKQEHHPHMCHDMYNEPFNESWSNLPDCGFHDSEEPPTVG